MSKRILVVDDEQSIRDSLSKVLHAEGYDVVPAGDGQEAIDRLREGCIDLILLDLGLPVKDGWATLGWLAEVNPVFPVIVITGLWKQAGLAAAAGADLLMEKPLDVPQLLRNIRELLEEPAETRARRIRDRRRNFRRIACDSGRFREHLNQAYSTPFPSGEPGDLKSKYH